MSSFGGALRSRRLAAGAFTAVAGFLVVVSVAWACTVAEGFTWYSDGTTTKSGGPSQVITAYGTNALRNTPFYLVTGRNESGEAHANHSCMDSLQNVNPNVRTSNNRGFIGNTSGPVNRAAGVWQVCFRTLPGDAPYSTLAVLFTVT